MSSVRLKRCKFNWYKWLYESQDPRFIVDFWNKYNHKVYMGSKKHVSKNKCAYEVLKSYYSTTALANIQDYGVPSL